MSTKSKKPAKPPPWVASIAAQIDNIHWRLSKIDDRMHRIQKHIGAPESPPHTENKAK